MLTRKQKWVFAAARRVTSWIFMWRVGRALKNYWPGDAAREMDLFKETMAHIAEIEKACERESRNEPKGGRRPGYRPVN